MDVNDVDKIQKIMRENKAAAEAAEARRVREVNSREIRKAMDSLRVPSLSEFEAMIFKMRTQLEDYIGTHGLVDGLVWDGILQPVENRKIVITAEMVQAVTKTLGYITEPDAAVIIADFLTENFYVSDQNYVHTDNNFTDPEKQKLLEIEAKAQVNQIEDVTANGVSLLDPVDKTAKITSALVREWIESAPDCNVYTNADKAKLDGIKPGADVNRIDDVIYNGRSVLNEKKQAIIAKEDVKAAYESNPDTFPFTQADKDSLSGNTAHLTANDKKIQQNTADISTNAERIGELGNETNAIAGDVRKNTDKLAGIEDGAQVNTVTDVQIDGESLLLKDKIANIPFGTFYTLKNAKNISNELKDFNDYINPGIYYSFKAVPYEAANYPTGFTRAAFVLTVDENYTKVGIRQTLECLTADIFYKAIRYYRKESNEWKPWHRFYTESFKPSKSDVGLPKVDNTSDRNKNVLSATKLSTPRKIANKPFDGTKDIQISYLDLIDTPESPVTPADLPVKGVTVNGENVVDAQKVARVVVPEINTANYMTFKTVTDIPFDADLNTYTTPGQYRSNTQQNIGHQPVKAAFQMVVLQQIETTEVTQIVNTYPDFRTYHRTGMGDLWSEWEEAYTSSNPPPVPEFPVKDVQQDGMSIVNPEGVAEIPDISTNYISTLFKNRTVFTPGNPVPNNDFNDLWEIGNYAINDGNYIEKLNNNPAGRVSMFITLLQGAYAFQIEQIIIDSGSRIYLRVGNVKTKNWDPWATVFATNKKPTKTDVGLPLVDNTADAEKNVLSATKLTTPRKIAGKDFDGTADITIDYADLTGKPADVVTDVKFNSSTVVENGVAAITKEQVKIAYESNTDTNVFTDEEKRKLEATPIYLDHPIFASIGHNKSGDDPVTIYIFGKFAFIQMSLGFNLTFGGGYGTSAPGLTNLGYRFTNDWGISKDRFYSVVKGSNGKFTHVVVRGSWSLRDTGINIDYDEEGTDIGNIPNQVISFFAPVEKIPTP